MASASGRFTLRKITVVFASSSFPSRAWFGEKYLQGKKRYPVKLRAYRGRHYRSSVLERRHFEGISVSPTTSRLFEARPPRSQIFLPLVARPWLLPLFPLSCACACACGVGSSIVEVGRFLGSGGEGRQVPSRSVLDCAITAGSAFLREVKRAFTRLRIRIPCMAVVASAAAEPSRELTVLGLSMSHGHVGIKRFKHMEV